MESKRQLICDRVDARLKTILTANGYATDLGRNVFEWRENPIEEQELPAVVWRDVSEDDSSATAGTIGYHDHRMTMELKAATMRGRTTAREVRAILADIVRAVAVDPTWDKLAVRTDPMSNEMILEEAEKLIGGITITLAITYRTRKWDPYT